MATIHFGTATTLATIPKANISNGDIGYIWHASFSRKMVYDSTATNATDTTNHPYYIRPNDFAATGVWIEHVGADQPEAWSASQIVTGQLRSTNCTTATGSEYDLDNATIKLGGTQVDAAGSYRGIFAGLDSGLYKLYAGDGAYKYFKFDGTNISWRGVNASLSTTGVFTATNVVLTGTITAPTGAIGGWTLATTTIVSTDIGLHSASAASGAQILIGHSTSYASAKIGLKNDGSGKLADGKIIWTAAGAVTFDAPANAGTGVGIIYKDGKRWLYDFNPAHNGTVQPYGYNTFLGVECGNLTIGSTATNVNESSHNVGIGYQCLNGITKGYQNVAIGYQTMKNATEANFSIAIGYLSLYSATTGNYNTAVGNNNSYLTTTGYSNTAVGSGALYNNDDGANLSAFGVGAVQANTSGLKNCGFGSSALGYNTTGSNNIAIGYQAGVYDKDTNALTTPENSMYIGHITHSGSDSDGGEDAITNEMVFGYVTIGNGSNTVTLGNTSITNFHCQVALTVDSDERIKRNINPSLIGLSFINALNPITFQPKNPFDYPDDIKPSNYKDRIANEKDESGIEAEKLIKADPRPPDNDKIYIGLTAQQVEKAMALHHVNSEIVATSNQGKKGITYGNLIMPLITAVQELSAKITVLETNLLTERGK